MYVHQFELAVGIRTKSKNRINLHKFSFVDVLCVVFQFNRNRTNCRTLVVVTVIVVAPLSVTIFKIIAMMLHLQVHAFSATQCTIRSYIELKYAKRSNSSETMAHINALQDISGQVCRKCAHHIVHTDIPHHNVIKNFNQSATAAASILACAANASIYARLFSTKDMQLLT